MDNRIPVVDALRHAWFGKLPQDWNIKPVRIALQERYAKNDLGVRNNYLSLISGVGIVPYAEKGDLGNKKPEDLSKCKCVEQGDFVINSMNFVIGGFGRSSFSGICSPVYIVAKPNERQFDPRFLMRVFQVTEFQRHVGRLGNGILELRMAIGWDELKNQPIPAPPLPDQTRIANFLDEQTARIDALIAEKERLDALLGEYRGSLISAAVTGQLSTAIVSDGRVGGGVKPASWRKLSLKRVAEIMPSNVDKHSVEGELPVQLCNYVDVYNNDRIDDSIDFMVATASEAQITRFTLKAHDVLVTKDSEEPSDIGIPAYVPQDMPGILCGYHLAVLRPDLMRVHGAFLHWALQSTEVQAYYETAALGISRYALGINDLGMTPLHLPDRAEQTHIANFLDEQTARIDDLRNHCREHVALLREYRSSLISAAVTGQLDMDGSKSCLS